MMAQPGRIGKRLEPPNVLRFSCRRGALRKLSKCPRSRAPKAVSCKRLLDGSADVFTTRSYQALSYKEYLNEDEKYLPDVVTLMVNSLNRSGL